MISFFRNLFSKPKPDDTNRDLMAGSQHHDDDLNQFSKYTAIFKTPLEVVVKRECNEIEYLSGTTPQPTKKHKKLKRKTTIVEKYDQVPTIYNDRDEFTRIPLITYQCFEKLEKFADKEGVFRVPGSSVEVDKIVKDVNSGIVVNLKSYSVNTVASLLKKYIRELPDPLLTFEGYEDWTRLSSIENVEEAREHMKKIFTTLPPCNRSLFISLLSLLRKISETPNIETSRMTESNLAFIWSMNILKPPGETGLVRSDIAKVSHALIFCIKEYSTLNELYQQLVKYQQQQTNQDSTSL